MPLVARLRAAGCVFAEDEAALLVATAAGERLERLVRRRIGGEPLETVLGWVEFGGLRLSMAPGVFVPRARTMYLVEVAAALAPRGGQVADVCCGIGAVAALLRVRRPDVGLRAADIDPRATRCAQRNLDSVPVYTGDLLEPLPAADRGRLDVVVANTPYVPTDELAMMPREARDHEPAFALDGGADGLAVQRRLAAAAHSWVVPGGTVLTEIAGAQEAPARAVFEAAGWAVRLRPSEQWGSTVVVATRD
ncbi:putative protein N(5)-glutamine methyltransferase [Ruania alba]|uniref:Release factor glutamine methyltransferase n=1 Tax=Ruania alba TaxID=648782 RepID=A0A1H5FYR3_9MICO|nr:putative protein N(5)-glutamine methyltransferase [Ruania alba]SEE08304.1 release factor glutamine methyltransferase [Ruania alba]